MILFLFSQIAFDLIHIQQDMCMLALEDTKLNLDKYPKDQPLYVWKVAEYIKNKILTRL
jgi:hypothetical protein